MQKHTMHLVPMACKTDERRNHPRINITFRWIRVHKQQCPLARDQSFETVERASADVASCRRRTAVQHGGADTDGDAAHELPRDSASGVGSGKRAVEALLAKDDTAKLPGRRCTDECAEASASTPEGASAFDRAEEHGGQRPVDHVKLWDAAGGEMIACPRRSSSKPPPWASECTGVKILAAPAARSLFGEGHRKRPWPEPHMCPGAGNGYIRRWAPLGRVASAALAAKPVDGVRPMRWQPCDSCGHACWGGGRQCQEGDGEFVGQWFCRCCWANWAEAGFAEARAAAEMAMGPMLGFGMPMRPPALPPMFGPPPPFLPPFAPPLPATPLLPSLPPDPALLAAQHNGSWTASCGMHDNIGIGMHGNLPSPDAWPLHVAEHDWRVLPLEDQPRDTACF